MKPAVRGLAKLPDLYDCDEIPRCEPIELLHRPAKGQNLQHQPALVDAQRLGFSALGVVDAPTKESD